MAYSLLRSPRSVSSCPLSSLLAPSQKTKKHTIHRPTTHDLRQSDKLIARKVKMGAEEEAQRGRSHRSSIEISSWAYLSQLGAGSHPQHCL